MERVFVDTNIILDWLGRREPHFQYAKDIFKKAENKELVILVSTLSFITVEYILTKELGKEQVMKALAGIKAIVSICTSGEKEIDLALLSNFKDFEDAFQYYTAKNNHAEVIITRNVKDFKDVDMPAMTAEEYLKTFRI